MYTLQGYIEQHQGGQEEGIVLRPQPLLGFLQERQDINRLNNLGLAILNNFNGL